jgi:hypothetical protein
MWNSAETAGGKSQEPSIPSADAPTTKEVAAWAIGYDLQRNRLRPTAPGGAGASRGGRSDGGAAGAVHLGTPRSR